MSGLFGALRINFLPNNEILDWSKSKAFADNNAAQLMIDVYDRIENIVGKGENASFQHFLLFLQCFQKLPFSVLLKVGIVWYRVKSLLHMAILGSSNSAANKDMMSKICTNGDTII